MVNALADTSSVIASDRLSPPIPRLPARWHPLPRGFADDHRRLIHELSDGFDAPLHFVFPQIFADNVRAFQRVLDAQRVDGRILYAKKANKARCFTRATAELGIGLDAASPGEFVDGLAAGLRGDAIGVSGPAKSNELLQLALAHRALIAIDAPDELVRLGALAGAQRQTARVLLRMRPSPQSGSRFGLDESALDAAVSLCIRDAGDLKLEGFSFHLSGYCAADRGNQAAVALRACLAARARGLSPRTIDIGGGFAVSYADEDDWRTFLATQTPADYHANKQFGGGFYPYHQPRSGAAMLDAILQHVPDGETQSLSRLLERHDISLVLEPGRALLDQAGFTVFGVQGVKDQDGYGIVTASGMSFSLSEQWFDSEYLPDPELLPTARGTQTGSAASQPYRACVGGVSCLDSDMLTWRKVAFAQRPQPGDLLLYPNTAGYQMDSNESPFHALPLPPKLAVTCDAAGPHWRVDRPLPFSGA
ncbi:diaminopimelate decarboxylase [Paraburkholderia fungorum]|uniref:alanine racemase n=1 Tax=Paraburkholderia fungorum TaxID=134537 RepID=UPI00181325A4|nr:alanine racemase [Paraburkholderia fungorum]MBB4519736.1 diaminopimelate decarboxylase [Paraburkholderia fungorum]